MGDTSTKKRSPSRSRLPPRRGTEYVTIGQLSHAIGRPTGWWRRLDWLLKPIRAADGQRLYHCERALIFIGGYYGHEGWNAAWDDYERRCEERVKRRTRGR